MAYRLNKTESVPAGLRRVAREELIYAIRQLAPDNPAGRDEGIHEARKSMKKLRGLLRLLRPGLPVASRNANALLRDAGQKLSAFRDGAAMLETFDALMAQYHDEVAERPLDSVRSALLRRKEQLESSVDVDAVSKEVADALLRLRRRVGRWQLASEGFESIREGYEESYRRGRRALKAIRKEPYPENFHELRKRVKDHWYHVRLLETAQAEGYEAVLRDLQELLGDDHNLAVLKEQLSVDSRFYGSGDEVLLLMRLADEFQMQLRHVAMDIAEHVYSRKPGELGRQTARFWDLWLRGTTERPAAVPAAGQVA